MFNVWKIVELQKEESELCKELRLRALKDAPAAFAETYEDALERDDDYWDLISSSMVEPNKQRMFIAKESDNYIGSVYAILAMDDKSSGRLGGMWVDSRYRQKGVGVKLFLALKSWAKDLGLKRVILWVEDRETDAKVFYTRLGFIETGVKDYSKTKTNKNLCEMQFEL